MCLLPVCAAMYCILPIAVDSSFIGPHPPTGVSVDVVGDDFAVLSWDAQQSMKCDAVIENY